MYNSGMEIPPERVRNFLAKNRLLSLASVGKHGPWASTVFFAFDTDFHLYFYSDPRTQHAQNIADDPRVAITINQYWGEPGEIQGMQCAGEAAQLVGEEEQRQYEKYQQRYAWVDEYRDDHVVFRIVPTEIWMIDSESTGHIHRVQLDSAILRE